MSGSIPIKYVLQNDLTDTTALAVYNAHPTYFLSRGASAVPTYLYQSLKTIWVGASANTAYFQTLITNEVGDGQRNSPGSINISTQREVESVLQVQGSFQDDTIGAVVDPIVITITKPNGLAVSSSIVNNAAGRIIYLLDFLVRGKRTTPELPDIAVYQDINIDARCLFQLAYQSNPVPAEAARAELIFALNYVRQFGLQL